MGLARKRRRSERGETNGPPLRGWRIRLDAFRRDVCASRNAEIAREKFAPSFISCAARRSTFFTEYGALAAKSGRRAAHCGALLAAAWGIPAERGS
jgi:hypothetical protein